MPVGLISHVRRFFSRYPPERCSPDLSTFSPATSTSGFIIDAVLVPLHVGRVGLAHGESPVKNPNTRAHARMSQKEVVFFLNTPSTLNLKYSHPRFSEPPPPPAIFVWPWTHRLNMLQVCATRSNETAMLSQCSGNTRPSAPLRALPVSTHSQTHTHTQTHTRPHSLVDTRARTHPSLDRQMNEQSTAPWAVKTRLDVTGWPNVQMQPCDTFQWVWGGARPRACMRACSWVKIILRWAPFEAWTWKTNKNHTLLKCKIRIGFLILVFFIFLLVLFFFFFFFLKTGFMHLWCSTFALPSF